MVKCPCLYWITLSATKVVFPRGPVRATPHGSSVTTGNLDNNLLTREQGNFNQIIACCQNRTQVTVVRDTCTTTAPSVPFRSSVPPTLYPSISPPVPPLCPSHPPSHPTSLYSSVPWSVPSLICLPLFSSVSPSVPPSLSASPSPFPHPSVPS